MYEGVAVSKRERVVNTLTDRIRSGRFQPGSKLAGEHQLAEEFSVSRSTIRQALVELQHRKLITTRSGLGSFVTFNGHTLDRRLGWAQTLAQSGTATTTRVLEIEAISRTAHPVLAAHCPTEQAIRIRRVRSISPGKRAEDPGSGAGAAIPISLETSLIPAMGQLARLPESGLVNDSLWATLARAGLIASRGSQQVDIHPLTGPEAELLAADPASAYLRSRRTSFSADGLFVEHVTALLDPSRFSLTLEFDDAS